MGVGLRRRSACDLSEERLRVKRLFAIEEEAHASGFDVIAGVDEVGRGCLAGPVYAAAVVFARPVPLPGLDDSKVVLPEVRDALTPRIRAAASGVGLGAATAAEIDAVGIAEATLLAMRRALENLTAGGCAPRLVLLDAVRLPGLGAEQRSFIRGDARVACIAAASIVAKTARDLFMEELDASFPCYGFASHRGYATPEHLAALKRHGPSPAHRLTFDRVLARRRAGTARAA
jgi:ribonuclease HII